MISTMVYTDKIAEAKYNLESVKKSFADNDGNFEHCVNNFLSSAQSIIFTLNKSLSKTPGYTEWAEKRSERLPDISKTFRELRNISLKEGPVKSDVIKIGFNFGPNGISVPFRAKFTSPIVDTVGNQIIGKAMVETHDGEREEFEVQAIHDFSIKASSDGKTYNVEDFLKNASEYLSLLEKEVDTAEHLFN